MKLIDAIKLGKDCGLETIEECLRNVEIHALSLFKYEDINKELNEMHNEWKAALKDPGCCHDCMVCVTPIC